MELNVIVNVTDIPLVRMRVPSRGKMAAADISCTIPVGLQLCNGDVSDKIAQKVSTSLPAR